MVASRYRAFVTAEPLHELLERLGHLLRAEQRRLGTAHGLQPVHLQALAYLARANRYSDSPIAAAEFLGVTKGTMSQTLRVLQERELVQADDDPADARRVRLRPTAKGRRLLAQLPSALLRDALPAAAAAQLAASLTELLRAMQRSADGRTFGVCRTCRHFRSEAGGARCGLTGEPLPVEQTERLCREHAFPPGSPSAD